MGHTEYGAYATGRGVNAADLIAGADERGSCRTPPPGCRCARSAATRSRPPPRARRASSGGTSSRRCRCRSRQGASRCARRTRKQAARTTNTTPSAKSRRGRAAEKQVEMQQFGNYAGRAPEVGHGGGPVALHRLLGVRHRLLRREQHPDRRRAEVLRGREMTWMRIERYCEGGERRDAARGALRADDVPALRQRALRAGVPGVRRLPHAGRPQRPGLQPVRRHPVLRNNCPYKVRYFNWFAYDGRRPEPLNLQLNPDVTVRARASWRSAPSACSGSAARRTRRRSRTARSGTATSPAPARRPARRTRSSSAT